MTNVVVVERETALDTYSRDPRVNDVMDAALGRPNLIWLVLVAIREYHSYGELVKGKGGGPSLEVMVSRQHFGPRERMQSARIVAALKGLYRDHDAGNTRGMLLERIVQQQIQTRYSGQGGVCTDNVKIELGPNDSRHRTTKSLDVLGWDGTVGEGLDCKVSARHWSTKVSWLIELERQVVPRGLAVGLVTADSRGRAEVRLRSIGFRPRTTTLIPSEDLYSQRPRLPLNA